ncbi:MAG: nitrite reductase small subunit NirD [Aggregatilineales bacterium]
MLAPTITAEYLNTSVEVWHAVCPITDILPFTGVAALIEGQQIAVFRLHDPAKCYAISNYDPFSNAYVIARGLVGDKNGILKVASPIYKNTFNLLTGQCLEDATVQLPSWPARVMAGIVQVALTS